MVSAIVDEGITLLVMLTSVTVASARREVLQGRRKQKFIGLAIIIIHYDYIPAHFGSYTSLTFAYIVCLHADRIYD